VVSYASLRKPRSHGFYRFFAWEAILALVLLNLPVWFLRPFAWHQLISWALLIISLFLVITGLNLLRTTGNPQPERQDPTLLGLEKTTKLVTTGLYRHIRHPMYSSLLFLAGGVFFKQLSWLGLALAAAATYCLVRTARLEEIENIQYFGAAYQDYKQRTRMFIPGIF
jgi:protein-S-isoprenylcysteine O-methyltransferase Ste14